MIFIELAKQTKRHQLIISGKKYAQYCAAQYYCDDNLFRAYKGSEQYHIFENAFKTYPLSIKTLLAYAQRRKKDVALRAYLNPLAVGQFSHSAENKPLKPQEKSLTWSPKLNAATHCRCCISTLKRCNSKIFYPSTRIQFFEQKSKVC